MSAMGQKNRERQGEAQGRPWWVGFVGSAEIWNVMVRVGSLRKYLSKDLKKSRELALWISGGRGRQVEKEERTKAHGKSAPDGLLRNHGEAKMRASRRWGTDGRQEIRGHGGGRVRQKRRHHS